MSRYFRKIMATRRTRISWRQGWFLSVRRRLHPVPILRGLIQRSHGTYAEVRLQIEWPQICTKNVSTKVGHVERDAHEGDLESVCHLCDDMRLGQKTEEFSTNLVWKW